MHWKNMRDQCPQYFPQIENLVINNKLKYFLQKRTVDVYYYYFTSATTITFYLALLHT